MTPSGTFVRREASGLGRYRASVPLLATGIYALFATILPYQRSPLYLATAGVALLGLLACPFVQPRRVQVALGLYLFLLALGANLLMFGGPRVVSSPFRALGWIAYVLSWGGVVPLVRTEPESWPAELTASHTEPLRSRREAPTWPFVILGLVLLAAIGLFLWPASALAQAHLVLFRTAGVVVGFTMVTLAADVLSEFLFRSREGEGSRVLSVAFWVLLAVGLSVTTAAALGWTSGKDFEALGLGVLAGLIVTTVLRLRRKTSTKIEL
jgi:hypothetical protein